MKKNTLLFSNISALLIVLCALIVSLMTIPPDFFDWVHAQRVWITTLSLNIWLIIFMVMFTINIVLTIAEKTVPGRYGRRIGPDKMSIGFGAGVLMGAVYHIIFTKPFNGAIILFYILLFSSGILAIIGGFLAMRD